jgi:hypothetical protein
MKGLIVATAVFAVAGCGSTTSTTPRWGYGGPPPLYGYLDGYVEDRTAAGPLPTWAAESGNNIPGQRRYANFPRVPDEWYTFAGPEGPGGKQGPVGVVGAAGPVGLAGQAGPVGAAGIDGALGPSGPQGIAGLAGPLGPQGGRGGRMGETR